MKGGKPGLNVRRKGALARLEVTYEAFKKAGEDKRNLITGKTIPYDQEMSTIGQVRRMLRIQALEAAKREDYRTRTRV